MHCLFKLANPGKSRSDLLHTFALLSCVVLHLCSQLFGYWRQIWRLFPAGYIQRLCCGATGGCIVFDAGLDELCCGIWNGLICGWRIPSWTCIAKIGVVKGFNLTKLVGEVHVTVYGCFRTKLSSLFVFWVASIIGYAVSWVDETKQHMNKAITQQAVYLQHFDMEGFIFAILRASMRWFCTNLAGCTLSCYCHWCRCHYCSSWCCSPYDWHMHWASFLAATAGSVARPCWEGQLCNKKDPRAVSQTLPSSYITNEWTCSGWTQHFKEQEDVSP